MCLLYTLYCFTVFWCCALSEQPEVTLADGTRVQGLQSGSVVSFKGIPFAQPPIGKLRWAPPREWVNPYPGEVLNATQFGSTCMQNIWGSDGLFRDHGEEDCLFLNVYVNLDVSNSGDRVPVAVFIHGGGYVSGTANIPLYDGVDMVDYLQGGAIVVTMNYRLNVFGFIGSEELRGQDVENGSTGNYGIQDQRMAMGWVQKNIGAFGGDNSRVTIFGQSAGAGSVTNHLTMKRSWPLFHGAIVESGAFYESVLQNMSVAAWTYDNFLRAAGCGGLDCLLALPAQDILTAGNSLPSFDPHLTGNPFRPTADGVEISTHPWIAASNGDVADVPVVMGSCADDGAIFTYVPHDLTEEGLCAYWQKKGYSVGDIQRLMEIYVQNGSYNEWEHATVHWWAAQRSNGDKSYTCPAVFASALLAAQYATEQRSSPTYEYLFSHKPRYANLTRHLADLEFVFHQKELLAHEADMQLADVMSSYWGKFFASRDPNSGEVGLDSVPPWLPYDTTADQVTNIVAADNITLIKGMKHDACEFHNARIDEAVRSSFPPY